MIEHGTGPEPGQRSYLTVGLTGGIASGKTTVARFFAGLGACVVDADQIGHEVMEPGGGAFQPVVERFGPEILDSSGAIVRSRLGEIVFADPEGLAALNLIVHPEIAAESKRRMLACAETGARVIVYDAALLIETGRHREFDRLVVTACSEATQLARIIERDGLSEAKARARIEAQAPLDEKVDMADHVVDTEGPIDAIRTRVAEIYGALLAAI